MDNELGDPMVHLYTHCFSGIARPAKSTRVFLGYCDLQTIDCETGEIRYAVMPSARNQGYDWDTSKSLERFAIPNLGYRKVRAPIDPKNKYSRLAAIHAGFKDHGAIERLNPRRFVHDFLFEK